MDFTGLKFLKIHILIDYSDLTNKNGKIRHSDIILSIKYKSLQFLAKLVTWYDSFLKIEVTLKAYWTLQPFVVKRHEF